MRIGLLGYGAHGRRCARAIARVADLAVIVDPNQENLLEAGRAWGPWGTHVSTNPADAFRCDAVWIATPADTHAALVDEALDAGCHVLCEKPFVLVPAEAAMLATKADEKDLVLMVGHLSLYSPEHPDYLIGGVREIETRRWNTAPALSDHSVLWGLGPHDVATILCLMGRMPDEVRCKGTRHRAVASMEWDDGRSATMEFDWLATTRWRLFRADSARIVNSLEPTGEHHGPTDEPLLVEADAFVHLCAGDDREERDRVIAEAVDVTSVLHRLHVAMSPLATI